MFAICLSAGFHRWNQGRLQWVESKKSEKQGKVHEPVLRFVHFSLLVLHKMLKVSYFSIFNGVLLHNFVFH